MAAAVATIPVPITDANQLGPRLPRTSRMRPLPDEVVVMKAEGYSRTRDGG